jgi:hypothetical protein
MKTIGELLPKEQANLLTPKVKGMTKAQLEKELKTHPRSDLSFKDYERLMAVVTKRVNSGQTVLTYSSHNFKHNPQDPSTCSCLV